MPEKKPSVSSAEEELVQETEDYEAQLKTRPAVKKGLYCILHIALQMLLLTLGVAIILSIGYFILRRGNSYCGHEKDGLHRGPLYANFMMDVRGFNKCDASLRRESVRPCMAGRKLVTGTREVDAKAFALGPMTCWDDAHLESGGSDNCQGNPFVLAENNTGILVPETAVYRVYAKVTFDDPVDYYVNAIIRVVPASCLADAACSPAQPEQRDARSHTWLSCFNHNRPPAKKRAGGAMESSQFVTCTLDGIRRFSRGDLISLQTTQEFRLINPYRKLTNLFIHRI